MSRAFPTERIQRADIGPPTEVTVIQCSACPARLELTSKSKEPLPADFIRRQADIKGWHVGKLRATEDRCPGCQTKYRRKSTVQPRAVIRPIIMQEPTPMSTSPAAKPGFKPVHGTLIEPREMSKDDRRIIFTKIDEVYRGDCYSAGWTDKRIAEDLNVPRAWVEGIRSEFFGEANDNEEVRQFLADLDAIKPALVDFAADRQAFIRRLDDMTTKIAKLLKVGEEIRKTITP